MRIYYDTEFLDDGLTIEFVSIGMVRENGDTYYAVNSSMNFERVKRHDWLFRNVVPYLPTKILGKELILDREHADVKPKSLIKEEVRRFVLEVNRPELWAWYASYDHVVLCQLFGRMEDLPSTFPKFTNDLRQEVRRLNDVQLPKQTVKEHHALADAYWVKEAHQYLLLEVITQEL